MANPPLKRLREDDQLSRAKLEKYGKTSTDKLIESLQPGKQGSLKTRPDGTMVDGHHRIKILKDRGIDVDGRGKLFPRMIHWRRMIHENQDVSD